jgi:hypothetical protein
MRLFIALAALVATTACKLDTTTNNTINANLAGSYSLQSIDGAPMPVTTVSNDTTVTIDGDVLVLDGIGNWGEIVRYHRTVGAAAAVADSLQLGGIWLSSGNTLNFRTSQSLLYVGTATDSTLSLSDAISVYEFKR